MNLGSRVTPVVILMGMLTVYANGKSVCTRTSHISVLLNTACNTDQMIHVVSKNVTYADNKWTSCKTSMEHNKCNEYRINDREGLKVNCNGHSSCYESISTSISGCARGSNASIVELEYECIEGSVNICSGYSVKDSEPLYLHSSSLEEEFDTVYHCTCVLSGVNMNVILFQLYLATVDTFSIYYNTNVLWQLSKHIDAAYNRQILTNYTGDVNILYNTTGRLYGLRLWIEITGTTKTLICTNSTLPWSSTTVQPVTRENTSPSVDKPGTVTQLMIALACACVLVVLLVTVVCVLSIKFHWYRKSHPPVELNDYARDQTQTDSPDRNPGGDSQVSVDHTGVYMDVDNVSHVYSGLAARDSPGNTDYTSLRVKDAPKDT